MSPSELRDVAIFSGLDPIGKKFELVQRLNLFWGRVEGHSWFERLAAERQHYDIAADSDGDAPIVAVNVVTEQAALGSEFVTQSCGEFSLEAVGNDGDGTVQGSGVHNETSSANAASANANLAHGAADQSADMSFAS